MQQGLRWRCFVEEYNPTLHYITGPKNTIADTFSQLHHRDYDVTQNGKGKHAVPLVVPLSTSLHSKSEDAYHSLLDNPELVECFLTLSNDECYLNLPNIITADSPLNFKTIKDK